MFLYIDPGTGSMLFSIFIGVVSTLVFFGRQLFIKLKFTFSSKNKSTPPHTYNKVNYLIFSDNKRYWSVFKPICDEFEKRAIDVVYWTLSPDDPALSENYNHVEREFIGEGNKGFARLNMLKASIVLSTTPGLSVYQWKRSRSVDWYVHIFHSVSDGTGYRMFGLYDYDAILTGGPIANHYLALLDQKRNLPAKDIRLVGITYMDSLKQRLLDTPKVKKDATTVLLAPSWGESGILSKYGEKIISSLAGTGYNVIIRPHPQSFVSEKHIIEPLIKKFPSSQKLYWDTGSDNFASLNKSDIMISDFSGVIYDYALIFEKPIIYAKAVFDSSPYDAAWIDEEKWMIRMLPKLGQELNEADFPNIKDIIEKNLNSKDFKTNLEEIKKQAWCEEGHAAKNIADYMISKRGEL